MKIIKQIIKKVFRYLGFIPLQQSIHPQQRRKFVHDPAYSYLESPDLQERLIDELFEVSASFFSEQFPLKTAIPPLSRKSIENFFHMYRHRPVIDNTGGSGFHNSFWIYLYLKSFAPKLVVESGVWKGQTTWLISQAVPGARILGFDPNMKRLEYYNENIQFIEDDWSSYQFADVDPDSSLIFFDCHVNHAQRIIEARNAGFKHLIFDDNPPGHKIYSYKNPGFPTAHMLTNLQSYRQESITWHWKGEKITREFDLQQAKQAASLIKHHILFPDVGGPTRYGGFSFLTYIQIN